MSPGLVHSVAAVPQNSWPPATQSIPGPITPTAAPASAIWVVGRAAKAATSAGSGRSHRPMVHCSACVLLMRMPSVRSVLSSEASTSVASA